MITWKINVIEQNTFDNHEPNDPLADYTWELIQVGSTEATRSVIEYAEIQVLMRHFSVNSALELVGKTFDSLHNHASQALRDFIKSCRS